MDILGWVSIIVSSALIFLVVLGVVSSLLWNTYKTTKGNLKNWQMFAEEQSRAHRRCMQKLHECQRKRNKEAMELMELRRFKFRFESLIAEAKKRKQA